MRYVFFFLVFSPFFADSQVSDSFSDGDFSNTPVWNGDAVQFKINTSGQLQLNSSGSDTSALSTPFLSTLSDNEWRFWVKMAFAPSDNNNIRIYLVSDQTNLKGALNGYYIAMGENGSFDSVDLWKQNGTTTTKIMDGINGHCSKSTNTLGIKVIRDNAGNWQIFSDTLGGNNYLPEGTVTDNTYSGSSFFGVFCKYTISNATKFYFDDIYAGSVIVDTTAPVIDSLKVLSSTQLDIFFNEALEITSAQAINNYSADKAIGNPSAATLDVNNYKLVHLSFASSFTNGIYYELMTNGVKDIKGNATVFLKDTFFYYVPEPISISDIIINEIMYEPKDNGAEFAEIYNRSQKIIDLQNIRLSSMDTVNGTLTEVKNISLQKHLIFPGEYYVLSTNSADVKKQYYTPSPNAFIEMSSTPSMNNAGDVLVLSDKNALIIDKVIYTPSMQFPLLTTTPGVSLERLSFDRSSDDKTNWHSASASIGFATPGYLNSQFNQAEVKPEINIQPEIFSPDNDGHNDVANISYSFDAPGYVANINIFDAQGILVRQLKKNEFLGTTGTFSWDGLNDNKEKSGMGIYIIYFEAFNSEGKIKWYKNTCVLGGKL